MRGVLASTRGETLAALDIGSNKICCLIARPHPDSLQPEVVGIGEQASQGVKCGAVIDMDAAEMAIRSAVDAAEKMADETVERVVVNLTGGSPLSAALGIDVAIAGHAVGDGDLRKAMEPERIGQAMNGSASGGREIVHSIATGYAIDGNSGIRDPRGMYGDRLSVNVHVVTAASGPVRNLTHCIERCHLSVAGLVISPYAAGMASLVEDEMDLGATLIDMGAGTTSIAVFAEGEVVFTDVLPVGGQHVTNDIARGLSTSRANAERMKTLYGHAMAAATDQRETIEVPQVGEEDEGNTRQIQRSLLTGIIQPRLEETFELVRARLEASGADRLAGRRVVLTGGASQLPGLRELASQALDKQVRVGKPGNIAGLSETTNGPAYATCAGLLAYAAEVQTATPEHDKGDRDAPSGVFGRIGHWLRENF
jgi:cell division protein FtsA